MLVCGRSDKGIFTENFHSKIERNTFPSRQAFSASKSRFFCIGFVGQTMGGRGKGEEERDTERGEANGGKRREHGDV